jgi:hypothetical protein
METNGVLPRRFSSWKTTLRAMRYRNYRLYFGGQGISLIGSWMQQVAMGWLVYRLTGSAFYLGVVRPDSGFFHVAIGRGFGRPLEPVAHHAGGPNTGHDSGFYFGFFDVQ